MFDQLAFTALLDDADARAGEIRDRNLGRVQEFFDALPEAKKLTLARYLEEAEYDTCVALSVAAGDWLRARASVRASLLEPSS